MVFTSSRLKYDCLMLLLTNACGVDTRKLALRRKYLHSKNNAQRKMTQTKMPAETHIAMVVTSVENYQCISKRKDKRDKKDGRERKGRNEES